MIVSLAVVAILLAVAIVFIIVRGIFCQMGDHPSTVVDVAVCVAKGSLAIDLPGRGEVDTSLYAAIRHMMDKQKEKSGLAQQIAVRFRMRANRCHRGNRVGQFFGRNLCVGESA